MKYGKRSHITFRLITALTSQSHSRKLKTTRCVIVDDRHRKQTSKVDAQSIARRKRACYELRLVQSITMCRRNGNIIPTNKKKIGTANSIGHPEILLSLE